MKYQGLRWSNLRLMYKDKANNSSKQRETTTLQTISMLGQDTIC